MNYKIDLTRIENDAIKGNTFLHNSGQRIKLLPFKTDYKEAVYQFDAILGELARLSMKKKPKNSICMKEVLEKLLTEVDTDEPEVLVRFIKNLYFKENGEIEPFHPKVFAYTKLTKEAQADQKSVARFIYDVLICGGSEEAFTKLYVAESDLVVGLLTKALPQLEDYPIGGESYSIHEPLVTQVFGEDLKILLKDEKLFIKWFKPFIEYYYFFYTSQTILKLNQRMQAKDALIPMYFLVGDESGSGERPSSKQGFKLLKMANANTFSNVMLCQFMNYNAEDKDGAYTFAQWHKQYVAQATEEEINGIIEEIEKFITFYKGKLQAIPWDQLESKVDKVADPLEKVVQKAFDHIKFQFVKGGRTAAANKYENWFYKFASQNYTKSGGRLGSLLNVKEDLLLFMIGLTLQGKDKERLSVVFEQLERRGFFFDDYSKEYIVNLLEVRNLLEKKSDSGDAKYVRAIL